MELDQQRAFGWQWRLSLLSLFWGSSYLLISILISSFTPLGVASFRLALGAATLLLILQLTGDRLPRTRRSWFYASICGIWMNSIPFTLLAIGQHYVSSVMAGLWNALVPLLVVGTSLLLLPEEHPTKQRIYGLVIGLIGLMLVLAVWNGFGEGEMIGHIALFGTVFCYGTGTPFMRRVFASRNESTVSLSAVQLGFGSVALLPLMLLTGDTGIHATPGARELIALAILGIFCTGFAYVLYSGLIRNAGAFIAASVTYLIPVVATALGVTVLGESFGWNEPVGGVVILLGVALATSSRANSRS